MTEEQTNSYDRLRAFEFEYLETLPNGDVRMAKYDRSCDTAHISLEVVVHPDGSTTEMRKPS